MVNKKRKKQMKEYSNRIYNQRKRKGLCVQCGVKLKNSTCKKCGRKSYLLHYLGEEKMKLIEKYGHVFKMWTMGIVEKVEEELPKLIPQIRECIGNGRYVFNFHGTDYCTMNMHCPLQEKNGNKLPYCERKRYYQILEMRR